MENNKIKLLEVNHEKDKKEFLLKNLRENNKDLISHKFDDNCDCCKQNINIHKIRYLNKKKN